MAPRLHLLRRFAQVDLLAIMSSEEQFVTPKTKKRVRQLITFYEEIGTPGRPSNDGTAEQVAPSVDETPSKKPKLKEDYVEAVALIEQTLTASAGAIIDETQTPSKKESRSARKSRRLKEATLAKYSKRIFCATEVLSTERSYVDGLQHLHKVRSCHKRHFNFAGAPLPHPPRFRL